jgi:CelD/BcsL family acetyltransferase involved in cellulose biosynthesis
VHTTPDALDGALADLTRVHDRAEAHRAKLHFLAGPFRPFTVAALAAAAAEGRAAAFVLRADGEPVGLHVVLTAGATAYAWLARADPAVAELAPGHLMLRAVVDWAIANGCDTVDLQLGDDPYKLRWSSSAYDTLGVVAAPPARLAAARSLLAGVDGVFRARAAAGRVAQRRGRARSSV